ncbi:MAG: glycosyltransferase [Jatrophihabitantaceae bacterium]
MRILLWHVHGSWTTAFVQGQHEYFLPVTPDRGPYGLGRARTWQWPASVVELSPQELAATDLDVVVLQRPEESELARRWLRRTPGVDLPAVYLEHNTPDAAPVGQRHPMAEQSAIPLVHVTHFNDLYWDSGRARTQVIEHGIPDPGERYSGELARIGVVVNDPLRRGRVVGADLLSRFCPVAPVDLFGMRVTDFVAQAGFDPARLSAHEDRSTQDDMHSQLAQRRVYLHPMRWTSLGLSLLEAMMLGMPVVALASTEAVDVVEPSCGVISTNVARLVEGVREFLAEPEAARLAGKAARAVARQRFGLDRFRSDWDRVLAETVAMRSANR